ncbi:DNA modification methylase [Flavobacterium sp.]|jgi:site-specific DNA-methyltransferase (adenine-specific)|uniref:DNA modification methylase n=1 Tax=Flavobacterium sp. TaxID=239 RepID=UPI0037C11629
MNKLQMPKVSVVAPQMLKKNSTTNSMYLVPVNYDEIRNNIQEFGLLTPLLVNYDYEIISGNLRHQIALDIGLEEVPVVFIDVPEEMKDVISVSTNKFRVKSIIEIASEVRFYEEFYSVGRGIRTDLNPQMKVVREEKDNAYKSIGQYKVNKIKSIQDKVIKLHGDDIEKINKEFSKIDKGEITLNELDKKLERELLKKYNDVIVRSNYEYITEKVKIYNSSCGDLFQLEDRSIQTIITSPPYFQMRNYGIGKNQLGLEKEVIDFINNLCDLFEDAKRVLKNDGSLFVNINDCVINGEYQSVPELFLIEMKKRGWKYVDQYLWLKSNVQFTQGKRSVRNFEPIFHFVKSADYFFNDTWLSEFIDENNSVSMGTKMKYPKLVSGLDFRDNILTHSGSNTLELRRKCLADANFLMEHSATYPLSLPLIFVLATSKPGDTILDMFNGTASTGEVSVLTDRKYVGYELNPQFVMASEVRLSEYDLGEVA